MSNFIIPSGNGQLPTPMQGEILPLSSMSPEEVDDGRFAKLSWAASERSIRREYLTPPNERKIT